MRIFHHFFFYFIAWLTRLFKSCNKLLVLGITSSLVFLVACAHLVPPVANHIPQIKVRNNNEIETIAIETYVASVLAGEVHSSWPIESLKAQAIAARTFALLRMEERKNQPFHIQNSVMDQVYKKKSNEIFIKAANESAGLVLTFNGKLAEASFHSTCGGKTTDSKSVWGRHYHHLRGGACGYCNKAPSYNWRTEILLSDIETKFSQKISNIKILSRTKDGRVDNILLSGNKTQKITGHEFRMAIGPMKVKSTLIREITLSLGKVSVKGQGFGHGVGMCQYGALGMAKAGKPYEEILSHYYPGTEIKKLY